MKTITIFTKDGPVILYDDTSQSKEDVIKDLSKMMEASTIAVVHTVNSSMLIRPSSITGVLVHEDAPLLPTQEATLQPEEKQPEIINKSEQTIETPDKDEDVDIITDME